MDNKAADIINGLINAIKEMDNSSKQFFETCSHLESTIILPLKQQLAKLYTDFYMYKARVLTSNFMIRWYWKWRVKRQRCVLRKFIENLPDGIKYEVTTELLEVTNGNRK